MLIVLCVRAERRIYAGAQFWESGGLEEAVSNALSKPEKECQILDTRLSH